MLISILLLAVLFIAGFVNLYFYFPTKKFHAWCFSFSPKSSSPAVPSARPQPASISQRSESNTIELKRVFSTFDKNGDGFITKEELRESLKNLRLFMTEKEIEEMVVKADANRDGLIDFDEFCILCQSLNGREGESGRNGEEGTEEGDGEEEDLKEAFDVFDKDRDGLISVEELGSVLCSLGLQEGKKIEDCKAMIRKVDVDGDGMVNFDEFKKMMKRGGGLVLAF